MATARVRVRLSLGSSLFWADRRVVEEAEGDVIWMQIEIPESEISGSERPVASARRADSSCASAAVLIRTLRRVDPTQGLDLAAALPTSCQREDAR